jgi:hypothetical protein
VVESAEHDLLAHLHALRHHAAAAAHHLEARTSGVSPDDGPTFSIHDVRVMIEDKLTRSGIGAVPHLEIAAALIRTVSRGATAGADL